MSPALEGRVALVTGAAQGIGAEIARRLHDDGARIAVNDLRDSDKLAAVSAPISGLRTAADVADREAVMAMVAHVERELGEVDVLVCNAALETMGEFQTQSTEDFWRQIDVNLGGAFACIQAVLPAMLAKGAGKIVVITSVAGVNGWARAVGYSASKAGLIGLVKSLGAELAPAGIHITGIAPGAIDSPQIEVDAVEYGVTLDALRKRYTEMTPLGRIGQPADIAGLVSLLAGPAVGDAFVGQILQPNGGIERGGG
ncbi:MAG: SDR family NAD(P)-dependent oxidoreductase [Solirubrobacteraceae bacterium]|jgi:NAD(P)-dependent dehydrogenase (short-subunit alcohol dehydrogenase family)